MAEIPDSVKQGRNFREMFGALTVEDWWAHSELMAERAKQLTHWSPEHDDAHSPAEWVVLLAQHVGDMADLALWSEGDRARFPDWIDTMKGHALHVGALAWAYVASLDRAILDAAERERTGGGEPPPADDAPQGDDDPSWKSFAEIDRDHSNSAPAAAPNDDTDRVEHPHKLDQSDWRAWAREHVTRGDLAVAEQIDPRAQFAALADLYEMIDATLATEIETIHGGQVGSGSGTRDALTRERAEGRKALARTLLALLRDRPQVYEALRAYQGPSLLLSRDERYS